MNKPPSWVIALILSVSSVSVFGLLCVTAVQLQEGNLQIRFEGPGGIKLDAGVSKGKVAEESERRLLPDR